MIVMMAILVGVLYTCGLYLMLQRSVVKLVFGLILLGHAANVLIFVTGGLVRGVPPLIPMEGSSPLPPQGAADPLPQALILTAIVIGFAVVAFAAVLVRRVYEALATDDLDAMTEPET